MRILFILLIFVSMLMLPGCAPKMDLGQGYERTSKHFLQMMRWKDFQAAATFFRTPQEGQKFLENFEALKDLNIVEADYKYSRANRTQQNAKSKIILTYYMLPSTRIEEWSWEMEWALLAADIRQPGTWQLLQAPSTYPGKSSGAGR